MKPPKPRQSLGKAVLSETLQHPATLLPGAGGVLSLLYMVAFGPNLNAFGCFLGAAGLSATAWIFNFFFRTEHFAQKVMAQWNNADQNERVQRIESLSESLQVHHMDRAYLSLTKIRSRYEQLVEILSRPNPPILAPDEFRRTMLEMFENALTLLENWVILEQTLLKQQTAPLSMDKIETALQNQEQQRLLQHRSEMMTNIEKIAQAFEDAILETLSFSEQASLKSHKTDESIEHFRASLDSVKKANAELLKMLQ